MPHCKRCSLAIVLAICTGILVPWIPQAVAADLDFTLDNPVEILPVNWFIELDAELTNTGPAGDRYDILRTIIYRPPNWQTAICVDGGCQMDTVDSLQVLLGAGASTLIGINFDTAVSEGGAIVQVKARSVLDPSKEKTVTMAAVTDGIEVLIVDDDGGQDYQDYLSAAFDGSRTWGVWPRDLEALLLADLQTFPVVAWMTGEAAPALSAEDTLAIGGFLDNGGRFFVTGQDVGFSMCDPTSPDYSLEMKAFYEDRFGATYVADDAGILTVEGVASDPITGGLNLAISGGDGANNQAAPSEIAANGAGSSVIFNYPTKGGPAAVKVDKNGYKLVYLAFGFEAISTSVDRADLAGTVYDWLVAVGSVDSEIPALSDATKLRCYPNPFNPSVTISFAVQRATTARVNIFDITGRQVVSIPLGVASAGRASVEWDGRDANGQAVASGVYTCLVSIDGGQALTEKLVLLK